MGRNQPLTALEASFLAIERPGLPMHVAALVMIDPGKPITLVQLRRMVASRLRRLPKFRLVVRFSPLGVARPAWITASRIHLDGHLFQHNLAAPGRRRQLESLCGSIHEQLLARDRPLWEMHLISGLEGGGQALMVKTHHAITDGLGGIELAEVLFDKESTHRHTIDVPPMRFAAGRDASPLSALQGLMGVAFTAAGGPLVAGGPFNAEVAPRRVFATATLQMDVVRRAKGLFGGSVDDVVLACVAAGLRRYLHEVGFPDVPHALRAMIPVSTRSPSGKASLGNHVTCVFVDLPLDTDDLRALVRAIATSKATLRAVHAALGMSMLIEAAGILPNRLHEAVVRLASEMPFANLIVSDVPGPDEPLFVMGRRIAAIYPMIPLPAGIGLSIATWSLGGFMGVGVVADPGLVPRPQRLAGAIEKVLADFERSKPVQRVTRAPAQERPAA